MHNVCSVREGRNMQTNSNSGGVTLDDEIEFGAFDSLPKEVRQALANAPMKLCAYSLKQKRWPKAKMLEAIAEKAQNASPVAR